MGLRARRLLLGGLCPREGQGRAPCPCTQRPHSTGGSQPRSEGRQKVGKPFQEPLSLGKLCPNPKSWLERNGGQPGPPLSPITVLVTASRNADSGAEPNGLAGAPKGPQRGHRQGQQEEEPPCHHLGVAAHPAWGHGGTEPPGRSPVPPSDPWPRGRSADCSVALWGGPKPPALSGTVRPERLGELPGALLRPGDFKPCPAGSARPRQAGISGRRGGTGHRDLHGL